MKIAVYPGSFDPITNGHLEIIRRAMNLFDQVIVLLAVNPGKKYTYSVEERLELIRGAVKGMPHVNVDVNYGLSVQYAKEKGAIALVRGLRAVSDFEYEFTLSAGNEFIDGSIDTVFFMSRAESTFISSSTVKELSENGVDVSKLVPPNVAEFLHKQK